MRPQKFIRFIVMITLLAAGGVLLQTAPAQDKKSKDKNAEKEQIKLTEVRFNLLVTDSAGKPVENVRAEDIRVFEDEAEQKITYFVRKELVANVGLVVDNSYSMKPQIGLIIGAGKVLVNNLAEKDEAFIVRFVNSEKITLEKDWTSDKNALNKILDNFYAEGGPTALTDGLYVAAEHILKRIGENNSKRYALVLISDCDDRDSFYRLETLFEKIKDTDLQIFVLRVPAVPDGEKALKDPPAVPQDKAVDYANLVAAKTGGVAYFPRVSKKSNEEVSASLKSIVQELMSQYVVGYVPANALPGSKARKLRVEVADGPNGAKRTVRVREGFVFPAEAKVIKTFRRSSIF